MDKFCVAQQTPATATSAAAAAARATAYIYNTYIKTRGMQKRRQTQRDCEWERGVDRNEPFWCSSHGTL